VGAQSHRFLAGLIAALLVAPGAVLASRPSHVVAVEPTSTRAAAFDATLLAVVGPESLESSTNDYEANLERLRALLPAGDEAREVALRSG